MTSLIIIETILATTAVAIFSTRYWFRQHPELYSLTIHYRVCGILQWLGILFSAAGGIASIMSPQPIPYSLMAMSGSLMAISMILKRKSLARRLGEKQKTHEV